jgi:hypothetical protein
LKSPCTGTGYVKVDVGNRYLRQNATYLLPDRAKEGQWVVSSIDDRVGGRGGVRVHNATRVNARAAGGALGNSATQTSSKNA